MIMIPFRDALAADDRKHVRRILESESDKPSRADEFLRDDTFITPDALEPFQRLESRHRERIISELIWRVTCHLDGSVTSVQGVTSHKLGRGFAAVQTEHEGRTVFLVGLREKGTD